MSISGTTPRHSTQTGSNDASAIDDCRGFVSVRSCWAQNRPLGFSERAASAVDDSLLAGDTVTRKRARPRAIEYSDAYYTRLTIHHWASYAELPLFAAEYVLGQRLLNEERTGFPSQGLKTAHTTVALGLGALFTINTVTGGWNLWESRKDPAGRTLRLLHSAACSAPMPGSPGRARVEAARNTRCLAPTSGLFLSAGIKLPRTGERRRNSANRQRRCSNRGSSHRCEHIRRVLSHLSPFRLHGGDQRLGLPVSLSRGTVRFDRYLDRGAADHESRGVRYELRCDNGRVDDHELKIAERRSAKGINGRQASLAFARSPRVARAPRRAWPLRASETWGRTSTRLLSPAGTHLPPQST